MELLLANIVPLGAAVAALLLMGAVWTFMAEPAEATPEPVDEAMPMLVRDEAEPNRLVTLGSYLRPDNVDEQKGWADWMSQAGYRQAYAVEQFFAARVIGAVAFPLVTGVSTGAKTGTQILVLLAAVGVGYMFPLMVVSEVRRRRQDVLRKAVPDMLDMLVSCLEAGLGTDAAMQYITRELRNSCPLLGDEMHAMNVAVTAGVPRIEAMKMLDRRTGIESISALVSVLGQAERFGAGVAPSVRAHADLSRRRRVLDAEQRAAAVSPRMTVVMIVFILPALFVVLVGPTAVKVVNDTDVPERLDP